MAQISCYYCSMMLMLTLLFQLLLFLLLFHFFFPLLRLLLLLLNWTNIITINKNLAQKEREREKERNCWNLRELVYVRTEQRKRENFITIVSLLIWLVLFHNRERERERERDNKWDWMILCIGSINSTNMHIQTYNELIYIINYWLLLSFWKTILKVLFISRKKLILFMYIYNNNIFNIYIYTYSR